MLDFKEAFKQAFKDSLKPAQRRELLFGNSNPKVFITTSKTLPSINPLITELPIKIEKPLTLKEQGKKAFKDGNFEELQELAEKKETINISNKSETTKSTLEQGINNIKANIEKVVSKTIDMLNPLSEGSQNEFGIITNAFLSSPTTAIIQKTTGKTPLQQFSNIPETINEFSNTIQENWKNNLKDLGLNIDFQKIKKYGIIIGIIVLVIGVLIALGYGLTPISRLIKK